MEYNKIIRRQNLIVSTGYDKVITDFKELFEGLDGVSIESSELAEDGTGTQQTKIYLEEKKRIYLLIVPDESVSIRMSIHCGDGTREGEDWAYIDQRTKDKFAYSFVRTDYGVAFSSFPFISDSKVSLSDGYIQSFFTVFETADGRNVNTFVYTGSSKEEMPNAVSYIVSEEHDKLELIDFGKCFYGNNANQTVLINATSYVRPIYSNCLYKKVQTEEGKFGKIKLNGRTFISGSQFCLETRED